MKKLAILASGSGTNAENITRYFSNNETIQVVVVLSNKKDAGVHERVKPFGIPSYTFSNKEFAEGELILSTLKEYGVDFIVLAGFLAKIPQVLLDVYPNQIINIHPALLPKFGGKGMYGMKVHEAVVANHEAITGITIHYIDEQYDEGTIIFQATCPVLPDETPEEVAAKVHILEYEHFPKVIEKLLIE
ncbi:phosphoribosylglycinamide formyltransferase [Parabacteroides pacaensis]|uniref:phosphoribosylglycinamide formyltransferase n=1 Tax=Parabacteroides pacaensis TaxID=2086575 RepID=UPI000D0E5AB0|nr:phosphoribosylglycinamide formyltransferase [Parabacteroides pacaensis]